MVGSVTSMFGGWYIIIFIVVAGIVWVLYRILSAPGAVAGMVSSATGAADGENNEHGASEKSQ